eukprot:m.114955 g.114955  ORF g.114955 m.114955 type:complete len:53 (-) comp16320_c0_seq3:2102-2260(-)
MIFTRWDFFKTKFLRLAALTAVCLLFALAWHRLCTWSLHRITITSFLWALTT